MSCLPFRLRRTRGACRASTRPPTYSRESKQRLIGEKAPDKVSAHSVVLAGNPSDEIPRVAEEQGVTLVVIATRGHTGWRRFVFGSVAERVVRLSPCPVLTIPEPAKVEP